MQYLNAMTYKQILKVAFFTLGLVGCESDTKISDIECTSLIVGISEMPLKNDLPANGNYYKILERSGDRDLTNCLLGEITNTTQMPDPRLSVPGRRTSVAVGDVSIFMLAEMYDIPFTSFIDETEWRKNGIYAYFEYIETDGARYKVAQTLREKLTASHLN